MTAVPQTLPDRQTIHLLDYLKRELNRSQYLSDAITTASPVVGKVMAAPPVRKEGQGMRFAKSGLPILAIYPEAGDMGAEMSMAYGGDSAKFVIDYLIRIPGAGEDFSGTGKAIAWARRIAWEIARLLRARSSYAMCTAAGIQDLKPGKYEILPFFPWGVLLTRLSLTVDHIEPPYTTQEPDDLREIAVTLNLYDQDDTDTGYDVEATVEIEQDG